ncbi:TPA: hypothetical protein KQD30_001993 [Clostridioides difficile]|nr:hypothetical protein [Clostridioides difficile]
MNEILNIQEIISIIPALLEYFVPGFIFLTIRNFYYSKDYTKDKYIIVKSIVISFLFYELLYPILMIIPNKHVSNYLFIIIVIFISIMYLKFNVEDKIIDIFGVGQRINEDDFANIIDVEKGTWVKVYLPEESIIYLGKLKYYSNKKDSEDNIMALICFATYSYDGEELENNSNSEKIW